MRHVSLERLLGFSKSDLVRVGINVLKGDRRGRHESVVLQLRLRDELGLTSGPGGEANNATDGDEVPQSHVIENRGDLKRERLAVDIVHVLSELEVRQRQMVVVEVRSEAHRDTEAIVLGLPLGMVIVGLSELSDLLDKGSSLLEGVEVERLRKEL